MMTACANSTAPLPNKNPLPADLTQECAPLSALSNKDGETVLKWALNTVYLYHECAARHRALIDAVK